MSASDQPIDAEWEPTAAERARRRESASSEGGVNLGTAITLSVVAAFAGAGMGATASNSSMFDKTSDAPADAVPQIPLNDVRALEARLKEIEARFTAVETAAVDPDDPSLTGRMMALQDSIASLQTRIGGADLAAMSAQVQRLQADTDTIRAQSESAAIAARAAFAVAAASEAARASGPFEQAYATLETILPGNPNIVALAPLARAGAPSRQELKEQFSSMEDDIVRAARVSASGAGFWGQVQAFLAQFVTVQRTGEGDTPVGMVERASGRLSSDDVAGAVAELSRLTGSAAQVAGPWVQRARARLEIDARLAAIRQDLSRGRTT
ncbi:MAG: mitofilin family membrane protein [Alphaproteobacteria bacterium]|nr:mitofilin family membrane protein [Alphaproteobacteria bacterium]